MYLEPVIERSGYNLLLQSRKRVYVLCQLSSDATSSVPVVLSFSGKRDELVTELAIDATAIISKSVHAAIFWWSARVEEPKTVTYDLVQGGYCGNNGRWNRTLTLKKLALVENPRPIHATYLFTAQRHARLVCMAS